jgi:hypothetical protein
MNGSTSQTLAHERNRRKCASCLAAALRMKSSAAFSHHWCLASSVSSAVQFFVISINMQVGLEYAIKDI